MRIAIIGTGIAGNVAAYKLRDRHEITVFEAEPRIGGHTNTVEVDDGPEQLAIDTGFIVFNDRTYPNFIELLGEIGQESQATDMSFSVQDEDRDFEFCGSTINSLFAQRSNILRPSFYRMIRDILRFNESMSKRNSVLGDSTTLGEFLQARRYGEKFVSRYLVPMAAAIWSAEPATVLKMPVNFLVRFFDNHGLLQLKDRPQWRVIKGGSHQYVEKLVKGHRDRIRLSSPVQSVRRTDTGVEITSSNGGTETFDAVFFACHSDQALRLIVDPTDAETDVLGAINYQENTAILHWDESAMPRRRRAWAAWNYHASRNHHSHVAVTYNMNILQRLEARKQYCVTLNRPEHIDPEKVLQRIEYQHPVFSIGMVAAQQRQGELNSGRTYFCGAYWRNGFHEDGVVSAIDAVEHFEERCEREQSHLRRAS